MATADERRKFRESWAGIVAILQCVLPLLGGMTWAIVMYHEHYSLWEIAPLSSAGTLTLKSIFAQPILLFLDMLPLTSTLRSWGVQLIVGYYAILTAILWNARRDHRRFWLAAALYGLHASLNIIGCLLYTDFFPHIPGIAQYPLWHDLRWLQDLGRQDPFTLFTFAVLLLAWHMFAWWRIWVGYARGAR